jgi:NIPSNAP
MIYELRTYIAMPGRLADLIARFENRTLRIWEKHGIRQAGFWTTAIGESHLQLIYMLAWENLADRAKRWDVFLIDPEWLATVAETEKDGPLVRNINSQLLEPTAFSSVR